MIELIPWFYGSMLLSGLAFLLISIVLGGLSDIDLDTDVDLDLDLDLDFDLDAGALEGGLDLDVDGAEASEAKNAGCLTIAAFLSVFGATGLVTTVLELPALLGVLFAAAVGVLVGRATGAIFRMVLRQQSADVRGETVKIGMEARMTVNTPPGHIGEALIESETVQKFPAQSADGDALTKGDLVAVVNIRDGRLIVRKA